MSSNSRTPEEQLLAAIELLKALDEPFNAREASKQFNWDTEPTTGTPMEMIKTAGMTHHVLYATAAKQSAMLDVPPDVPRISWSINALVTNEPITGGAADSIEQAMKFGETAYRAMFGANYKHDA